MPSLGQALSILFGLVGLVLFAAAALTPRDDGSRLYPRETICLCAMGLLSLAAVLVSDTDVGVVIKLGLVGAILTIIGARLFSYHRRRVLLAAK